MNILNLILLLAQSAKPEDNIIVENISKTDTFLDSLKGLSVGDALQKISQSLVHFAFNLAIAIIVFYVGKLVIKKLYRMLRDMMLRKKTDPSLSTFVLSLVKITLYFILIIIVIGILGIETSSFLALFASAGVAIGLALSGTLQNFAGGVLILLLKPYKVGDYIEAQGYTGTVKEIQIFHTIINTVDNKAIIIPNGGLSTSSINNYSLEDYRRVDWTVSLAYGTDLQKAFSRILAILDSDDRVVKEFVEDDRLERAVKQHEIEEERETVSMTSVGRRPSMLKRLFSRKERARDKVFLAEQAQRDRVVHAKQIVKVNRAPFVGLGEMADSSINITVRAWTQSKFYWDLFFEINRRLYTELSEQGFSFPFPQMDVHLLKSEDADTVKG